MIFSKSAYSTILVLCPVAIALVFASLTASTIHVSTLTHTSVLVTAVVFGTVDAVSILGKMPVDLNQFFNKTLPLYQAHASWLLPTLLILFVTAIMARLPIIARKFNVVDYRLHSTAKNQ